LQATAPKAKAESASAKLPVEKDAVTYSGRVVDPDGKAVAGAKVAFIADEKGAFVPQLASDHEGKFTLRIPRPRTVINPRHVLVSAPGFGIEWE
jgi:hypothetical protein